MDLAPKAVFVAEGGVTLHGTLSASAGVAWPWEWSRVWRGGEWSGTTELFVSHWSAKQSGGERAALTQVGVTPLLRCRFDSGRSPLFAEAGIGLSWLDSLYRSDRKQFSTRFNFYDAVGVGMNFGARGEHEIGVRFSHVSNAGIKRPNPGENFLQLRYVRNF